MSQPGYVAASSWQAMYNITEDEVITMLVKQNNRCCICDVEFTPRPGTMKTKHLTYHIDHDHATGGARGLLCQKCNLGIGYFNDDVILLNRVVEYLTLYQAKINLNERGE
jgi:hypothetical protein